MIGVLTGTLLSPSLLFISVNNNRKEVFYGGEAGRIITQHTKHNGFQSVSIICLVVKVIVCKI